MKKIPIQVRLTEGMIEGMDKLVEQGKFMNRSDFIRHSINNPDETRTKTLKESGSNPIKHKNLGVRLLNMEKKLDKISWGVSLNFLFLLIIFLYMLLFGGMFLL